MPTTVQPIAWWHCDSARVENRGPGMTTSVPPSTGDHPPSRGRDRDVVAPDRAVRVGEADVDDAGRRPS